MPNSLKRKIFVAAVASLGVFATSGAAFAVVPEIKVDPATGIAVPNLDLTIALAEIEADSKTTQIAENRWRRAPWFASGSPAKSAVPGREAA